VLAITGCAHTYDVQAPDGTKLATCYDGTLQSFCQVAQPPGTTVLPGTSIVSGITQLLMGSGALLALGLLGGCVPVFHITEGGKFTTDPISIPSAPMAIRAKCFGAAGCVTYQAPIGE
jgi:hypothetical protein